MKKAVPSRTSIDTSSAAVDTNTQHSPGSSIEFDINTNNDLPTRETLQKIQDFPILDQDGKVVPFKTLYTGPNVTRRVLIIFIRHFFCGNCQEYVRSLSRSGITPNTLLNLPTPTFIAIIGHGSPSLIPMYASETACPFPIYADPTKKLYDALGMMRTLNLGERPEYQRRELWSIVAASFMQSMKNLKGGLLLKGGDYQQVGGEFLFEPTTVSTPMASPEDEAGQEKRLGEGLDGKLGPEQTEEKHITWCHRMRNTRDHAEIPELREVLGLDGEGTPGHDAKRWQEALTKRKGTGFSSFGARSKLQDLEDESSGRESSEAGGAR